MESTMQEGGGQKAGTSCPRHERPAAKGGRGWQRTPPTAVKDKDGEGRGMGGGFLSGGQGADHSLRSVMERSTTICSFIGLCICSKKSVGVKVCEREPVRERKRAAEVRGCRHKEKEGPRGGGRGLIGESWQQP